jgi:hypothetical protein
MGFFLSLGLVQGERVFTLAAVRPLAPFGLLNASASVKADHRAGLPVFLVVVFLSHGSIITRTDKVVKIYFN